jgi:hypothetical protein
MKTNRIALAAAAAAVVAMPAFAADLTIVYKATTAEGSGTSTAYYSSERMRTGDGNVDTIIEYGPGRIISIDHKKKEYSETTLAEMDAAMARMQQASSQMEQQMASMPPAMRERMAQMMGGGAAAVTVTKGGMRKVAGYDCQEYTITAGSLMATRLCSTTAVAPPPASVDYRKYASLSSMANNPMFKNLGKAFEEMRKIQGFPLAESTTIKAMGRSTVTSKEALEVKRGPIPASAFDLTAIAPGYKKIAHPMTRMR